MELIFHPCENPFSLLIFTGLSKVRYTLVNTTRQLFSVPSHFLAAEGEAFQAIKKGIDQETIETCRSCMFLFGLFFMPKNREGIRHVGTFDLSRKA